MRNTGIASGCGTRLLQRQGDLCQEEACGRAGAAWLPASRADIPAAGPKQSEIMASNPRECWTSKAGDLGEPRGTSGYWGPRWKTGRAQAHSRGTSMETGVLLLGGQLGHGALWVPSQRLLNSSDDSTWPQVSLWANNFTAKCKSIQSCLIPIDCDLRKEWQELTLQSWDKCQDAQGEFLTLLLSVIFLHSQ